ncbi:MAG: ABC transporter ATP-binding protein, partial [Actinomycetota bacterium]|nr:ABC transporter ATP-binding protein [Actinomycetota bacterium]
HGLSLSIPAGGSIAIVGPSGCGKSTLLGLLGALDVPTSGRVTIGEVEVSALSERERAAVRRSDFGFVFQADNLQPFLTVSENVVLQCALGGDREGGSRARALLADLGLGDLLERLPSQLSGGQRQRVAVARALVHEPGIVLADEPTGALDTRTSGRVVDLLLAARERLGCTVVVVTHDPEVARRMDVTARMHDGRIAQSTERAVVG